MKLKTRTYRNNRSSYMLWFLLFIIIFISNDTLTFGTNEDSKYIIFKYVVYFLLTFFLLIKPNIKILTLKSSLYLYLIIISIFLTSLLHLDFRGGYVYQIWIILLAFLIAKSLSIEEFSVIFNRYIFILSIISILVFIVANSFDWLLDYFTVHVNTAGVEFANLYIAAVYKGVGLIRNTSIFREPGVFGIYLLLGIIFELFYSAKINKKHIFIFLIALFTTFSTAAFIILFLVIIGYLFKRDKMNFIKNKSTIIFFVAIVIVILSSYPETYLRIFSKLDSESVSYGNLTARVASIVVNFYIFVSNPVVGCGLSNYGDLFTTYSIQHFGIPLKASGQATNSFMSIFATYGFLYGSILICSFMGLIRKFSKNIFIQIILFLSLMMMFSNEDMRYSLLFYTLIFFGLKFTPKIIQQQTQPVSQPVK